MLPRELLVVRKRKGAIIPRYLSDTKLAEDYGIKKFPAVIVCTSQLKTWAEAPEVKIIKEWLKDLS